MSPLPNAVRMLSFFFVCLFVSTHLELPTRPVLFFLPTILFFLRVASSSGQSWYFMLYIACILFFFVMRAVQSLYPPLPSQSSTLAICPPLCAIPSRFCTHLTSWATFYPTRAYL